MLNTGSFLFPPFWKSKENQIEKPYIKLKIPKSVWEVKTQVNYFQAYVKYYTILIFQLKCTV